jgi:hypothetical protein
MAKSTALSKIIKEAKRIRNAHPNKYKGKKNPWANGYMEEASKKYNSGKLSGARKKKPAKASKKRKAPAKRKVASRKVATRKPTKKRAANKTRKRGRRRVGTKKPVKVTTSRSVVRTVGSRRRSVGKSNTTNLLIIGGLALGAWYLFGRRTTVATVPNTSSLITTSNVTRNSQSQDLVNYAIAAGLATNAILAIIDKINSSDDSTVSAIYNDVNSGSTPISGIV